MTSCLHPLSILVAACTAFAAPPAAWGRELPALDALGDAPLRMRAQADVASAGEPLPAQVHRISREERLGLPTFVQLGALPRTELPMRAQAVARDPAGAARSVLKGLAGLYGLSEREVEDAPLHHVQNLAAGARLVRLTNQRDGIEVFREQATVLFDARGQASAIGGYLGSTALAPDQRPASGSALAATHALARALQDFGFAPGVASQLQGAAATGRRPPGPYQWWGLPEGVHGAQGARLLGPARTRPVWFRLPQGLVRAYHVELQVREKGLLHAYSYVVAADDGRLLRRSSLNAHAQTFRYRAWADPATGVPLPGPQGRNASPHPTGLPDGFAPMLEPSRLVAAGHAVNPWLPDGARWTQGNNVQAFANLSQPEGLGPVDADECTGPVADDFRACATAPGLFDHAYDHARDPLSDKSQAAASVVNLFYVNNWLHDWFYEAGFDEAAGNAQADNFGRAGLDGDAMVAQALDLSRINNASMVVPADGSSPRMSMHLYLNQDVRLEVRAPAAIAATVAAAGADFGPPVADVQASVAVAEPAEACGPLANPAAITGRFALVSATGCPFDMKADMAQRAGAVGVVIVGHRPGRPMSMGIHDPGLQIRIPTVQISKADGDRWLQRLSVPETVSLSLGQRSVYRSSALDNSIITHEWGHYISNRLIGDANGLGTPHARGLGEGWSDFHALLMMAGEEDGQRPGNANYQGAYATATYAAGAVQGPSLDALDSALYGLRRYPYSTDMARNPLTFRHIQRSEALPAQPAPGFDSDNAEAHNMGEVWASMLWECYVALLNAHPFHEAQDRMKRYLVAGYKLTPIDPVLTEARDALLAAALAMDPADHRRFAQAFAKRGAGALARSPYDRYTVTNDGVVESYSTGGMLEADAFSLSLEQAGSQRCDADRFLDSGETAVLRLTLRNQGWAAVDQGEVSWGANLTGLEFPDGNQTGVPSLAPGQSAVVTARIRLNGLAAPALGRITAAVSHPGQPQGPQHNYLAVPLNLDVHAGRSATDSADALPSAMTFTSTSPQYADAWGVAVEAAPNLFYAAGSPGVAGSHRMQTPLLQVASTGDFTVSFRHRHAFETDGAYHYDGGQLMISTDDGSTWQRVDGLAYNGILAEGGGNPAQGEPAFVGDSAALPGFIQASVNLGGAYSGRAVRLAWVIHSDSVFASAGWQVDDIVLTGLANQPFPQAVADAQTCAGPEATMAVVDGSPQSAPVGTRFGQLLRLRLSDAHGQPLANRAITFTAPGSGPSARFAGGGASVQAVTDAQGMASVEATANALHGSYTVAAVGGGASAGLTLRNTVAAQQPGAGGRLAFQGPSPGGQGAVEFTVHGALRPLPAHAYYSQARITTQAQAGVPPLEGFHFPFGLAGFVLENAGQGNAVTFHIRYPAALPEGAGYWKYGRTSPTAAPHWHRLPMARIDARTIAITLTDGGLGDTDAMADGNLTDPGGLAVPVGGAAPAGVPIPFLSPQALALLVLCMAWLGVRAGRGRR
ncbi:M36 family metallopeptidase [Delftia tsuruhatensis]|uniref:M36 family metallopeptidase n=1 Tax=Delftia tsuruhatensis TaxID=180282 RepID=UPI001F3B97CB|nr:M36 family metallopeptidase [Delftia tsuruhatensis]